MENQQIRHSFLKTILQKGFPVLRIRIRMFLGLLDPDPLVRGTLRIRLRIFLSPSKNKPLIPAVL
jgi:hypothetical protein